MKWIFLDLIAYILLIRCWRWIWSHCFRTSILWLWESLLRNRSFDVTYISISDNILLTWFSKNIWRHWLCSFGCCDYPDSRDLLLLLLLSPSLILLEFGLPLKSSQQGKLFPFARKCWNIWHFQSCLSPFSGLWSLVNWASSASFHQYPKGVISN